MAKLQYKVKYCPMCGYNVEPYDVEFDGHWLYEGGMKSFCSNTKLRRI